MPGRNGTDAGGDRATRRRLTELARQAVGERLHPGDTAVDATAGNGHDTLFLALDVEGEHPSTFTHLPGGDRSRITNPASTLPALESALACLAAGGVLSVIAYPGHPGGHQETEAVEAWFRRHPGFRRIGPHGDPARSPRLFLLRRP